MAQEVGGMLGRAVRNRAVDAVMKGDPEMAQRKPPSGGESRNFENEPEAWACRFY